MNVRVSTLALLLAALFAPTLAFASSQDPINAPDQKRVLIRELLDTTGSINLGKQMMLRMVEVQKTGKTPEEQAVIEELASRMDASELIDQIIDIYDRHFTIEEISSVLEFYRSPAGRKFIAEMPTLLQEAMDLGAKWGDRKQRELMHEMQSAEKEK